MYEPLAAAGFDARIAAQLVGVAHLPALQNPDAQSAPLPHAAASAHVGAQAGATHAFAVQMSEPQSPFAPHGALSAHAGAHAGAAQTPIVHTSEPQSLLFTHFFPSAHAGAPSLAGFAPPAARSLPPQSTSVSLSFWMPSVSVADTHLSIVHTFD
jgi:hypothetical protein